MATTDTTINFKIITDSTATRTKTAEEFKEYLEDQIISLESQYENYIAFVVDNNNDAEGANRAILLRIQGGETQVFFNSSDTFLRSRAVSADEKVSNSDYGLMDPVDYLVLMNLNKNLNVNETSSIVKQNNTILNNIIELDEEKTTNVNNPIYKFKDKKISTIDNIDSELESIHEDIDNINSFINGNNDELVSNYVSLKEYIDAIVKESANDIINGYINHTHTGRTNI